MTVKQHLFGSPAGIILCVLLVFQGVSCGWAQEGSKTAKPAATTAAPVSKVDSRLLATLKKASYSYEEIEGGDLLRLHRHPLQRCGGNGDIPDRLPRRLRIRCDGDLSPHLFEKLEKTDPGGV